MKTLGIDYGRRKIGLAIAETFLAEPFGVILYEDLQRVIRQVKEVAEKEKAEKIVVGVSEGIMAKESREFAKNLEKEINLPIIFQDETLSTKEAQRMAIEAGIKRSKRKKLEDAYAATYMLQNYLDLTKDY